MIHAGQMLHGDFRDAGYKVFGLYGIDAAGRCLCGWEHCQAAGKHPVSSGWQYTPHWSDEQWEIGHMAGQFATGYGVLVEGLLVIDVDARNGGIESYQRLLAVVPEIAGAGLVVETGSGGGSRHLYFSLPAAVAMVQQLHDYPGIDFKSSGYVVGPGSIHASGRHYAAVVGTPFDIEAAPVALVDLLRKPDRYRSTTAGGVSLDVSAQDVADMLRHVEPDCGYDIWIKCGMAVHEALGGTDAALDIWDEWSKSGSKYPGRDKLDHHWHSFGKSSNPVTLATLAHHAELGGWRQPVEFTSGAEFDYAPAPIAATLDTSGIDLTRPPGFVGTVCQWINAQCMFPREHLAVASALQVVSSVAGMRYVDDLDGSTPNLFTFSIAGSATGKEAVLKAHTELLRAAGVSAAVHGTLKSEQEIFRNLCRHQAAYYVVDEMGEVLAKITNAMKRGSAAYLEGIIGTLMSLYSKANSYALISGDLKEEIKAKLKQERAGWQKCKDNLDKGHESADSHMARIDKALSTLDQGLERPYLSVMGFSTPDKFRELMTAEMATNGFMGRSLIFTEMEDNPKRKPRANRGPVPDDIAQALQMLYAPGYASIRGQERIERMGHDPVAIQTRPDAAALLDEVGAAFWRQAEQHKDQTGLSAIPRRGYEQVAKLSMVLAIPGGLRTAEHVMWAYALVSRDIEGKLRIANANAAIDAGDALASMIMSAVSKDHGESARRIKRACKKYAGKDVQSALDKLVALGALRIEPSAHSGPGRPTELYYES